VLVVLVFIVVGAWGLTYWAANYNNRSPTPIDGIWSVTSQSGTEPFTARWQHVFFERNRAHMVVFRTAAGPDEVHHFEVDENGTVRIWQTWLSKGGLIMQGQAKSDGQVELEIAPVKGGGHLVLQRMKPEL
jgi:hypothetical protein